MDNRRNFAKPVRDELRAGLGVQKPLGPIGGYGKRGEIGGSQRQRTYFAVCDDTVPEVAERAVAMRCRWGTTTIAA